MPIPAGTTLLIGLGGTGYEVLLRVKRNAIRASGDMPSYIRLLAIDCDERQARERHSLEYGVHALSGSELLHLPVRHVCDAVEHSDVRDWWISDSQFEHGLSWDGSRQIRKLGRLALAVNFDAVTTAIRDALNSLRRAGRNDGPNPGTPLQIHVIASLAGGMGSGSFLDVAMLSRGFYHDLSYPALLCTATLVMPSMYEHIANASPGQVDRMRQNAQAALLEFEYLSRTPGDYRFIRRPWGDTQRDTPPFDNVTLVDRHGGDGGILRDLPDLYEVTARIVGAMLGSESCDAPPARRLIELTACVPHPLTLISTASLAKVGIHA